MLTLNRHELAALLKKEKLFDGAKLPAPPAQGEVSEHGLTFPKFGDGEEWKRGVELETRVVKEFGDRVEVHPPGDRREGLAGSSELKAGRCEGCEGSCSGDCEGGCSDSCDASCRGGCGTECSSTCSGSCRGDCSGNCSDSCSGDCGRDCSGSCDRSCSSRCSHDCESQCVSGCDGSCTGDCEGSATVGV